jgi:DNA-binding XRE family transcriptional regulator
VFGRTLVVYRQRSGLTQQELAGKTGLSVRAIRDLESGRVRAPRQMSVRLLADAFGLQGSEREWFHLQASGAAGAARGSGLNGGRGAHAVAGGGTGAAVAGLGGVPPAQLPTDAAYFTGRDAELAELDALAGAAVADGGPTREAAAGNGAAVVVTVITGTAGVGKTTLAVHWAHRARSQFRDGQLYVNLRGYDPGPPMPVGEALAGFLRALGVSSCDLPIAEDERAALYRSLLSGRRMLVVLDNAGSAEQVRPLLPGSGSCLVLVTSRDSLRGLVAREGARRLNLDKLPLPEAVALLRALVGRRIDAEPAVAARLADQCARLPLALRMAAERITGRPDLPLTKVIAELADERRRQELSAAADDARANVRIVFSTSYQQLWQ